MTLKTPFFQIVQYIEYHCISVRGYQHLRVPVLNNFLISVLHYSHTKIEISILAAWIHRLYQLIEKVMGIYQNFNIVHPLLDLSFVFLSERENGQQKFQ